MHIYSTQSRSPHIAHTARPDGLPPESAPEQQDSYQASQKDEGINWSRGARVAATLALFAAPAALGAASGNSNLAMGGMLGSMTCAVFTSPRTNHDGAVFVQALGAIGGTALAAAAGGFGGYTGAAVVIGGLAAIGGAMAAVPPPEYHS